MFRLDERQMIRTAPFGMDLVLSIFYLAAPLTLIKLGANPIELGLIGTLISSVHMALANFTGHLSDQWGRRLLIITGPVILGASCLLMTAAEQVKVVLALSALNGLGLAIFWPSFQAWVAERQTESGLAHDIGSFNMSWTAANLTGSVVSGFLYSYHPHLPFWVAALISLLLVLLTCTSVSDREPRRAHREETLEGDEQGWRKGFLYAGWVGNFASWFILGNARYQFPKLARELTIDPQRIGLLIGCIGLSQFFGFFCLRRSERWHFRKHYLLGGQLLAAAGILLLFLSSEQTLFAFAFITIGLCSSITYYSSLYYAVHLLKKKGKGAGMHESILGSGALLGPILGGIAAYYGGLRAPYLLCLAVLFIVIAAEWHLTKIRDAAEP